LSLEEVWCSRATEVADGEEQLEQHVAKSAEKLTGTAADEKR
jgi:hypothetical protein